MAEPACPLNHPRGAALSPPVHGPCAVGSAPAARGTAPALRGGALAPGGAPPATHTRLPTRHGVDGAGRGMACACRERRTALLCTAYVRSRRRCGGGPLSCLLLPCARGPGLRVLPASALPNGLLLLGPIGPSLRILRSVALSLHIPYVWLWSNKVEPVVVPTALRTFRCREFGKTSNLGARQGSAGSQCFDALELPRVVGTRRNCGGLHADILGI